MLELDALSLVLANVQNTSKPTDRLTHIPTSPTTCIKQSILFLVPEVGVTRWARHWLPEGLGLGGQGIAAGPEAGVAVAGVCSACCILRCWECCLLAPCPCVGCLSSLGWAIHGYRRILPFCCKYVSDWMG